MPLIVFEGIDGCGKSTQIERLAQRLVVAGRPPLRLREPGGTILGERMRELLLDHGTRACPVAELFGYLQARAQLVEERIKPALAEGRVLLLDRFWYSTIAYQAYGLGLPLAPVRAAIELALDGVRSDLAIYLRIDPELGAQRRAVAHESLKGEGSAPAGDDSPAHEDRIEARGIDYLRRVREGYEALVAEGALTAVDGANDANSTADAIWALVEPLLDVRRS